VLVGVKDARFARAARGGLRPSMTPTARVAERLLRGRAATRRDLARQSGRPLEVASLAAPTLRADHPDHRHGVVLDHAASLAALCADTTAAS